MPNARGNELTTNEIAGLRDLLDRKQINERIYVYGSGVHELTIVDRELAGTRLHLRALLDPRAQQVLRIYSQRKVRSSCVPLAG